MPAGATARSHRSGRSAPHGTDRRRDHRSQSSAEMALTKSWLGRFRKISGAFRDALDLHTPLSVPTVQHGRPPRTLRGLAQGGGQAPIWQTLDPILRLSTGAYVHERVTYSRRRCDRTRGELFIRCWCPKEIWPGSYGCRNQNRANGTL